MTEEKKGPGEAQGDGRAAHGYRNEVSWDDGQGRQPYANRGDQESGPAVTEHEGGDAGEAARRNAEDLEKVKRAP